MVKKVIALCLLGFACDGDGNEEEFDARDLTFEESGPTLEPLESSAVDAGDGYTDDDDADN